MATDDPIQSIITRQIYLNRYSNGVSNRLLTLLNDAYIDAVKQLATIDLGQGGSPSSYNAQRLRAFLLQTRQSIATAGIQAEVQLVEALQGVAEAQTEFIQRQMALAIEGGTINGRTIGPTLSADTIPSSVVINTVEVPPNYARLLATQNPSDIPLILGREKAESMAQAVADMPVTINLRTPLGTELARTMDNVPIIKRFRAITEGSADLFDRQVRLGLMQSETTDQITRRLVGQIQYKEGRTFLGKGAALEAKNAQVRTLVRTSVQNVANAANQAVYQANQHVTKKYRYLATLDSRTTAQCRALDRKVFKYGEGPTPPLHFNCLTEDTLVSPIGRVAAVYERTYKGVVYRFTTTRNNCFSCTPNHPILTSRGWVPAQFVNKGDEIVCYFGGELVSSVNGQNNQVKTAIKDFVRAFRESCGVLSCEVPISSPDFHGDGVNGEVAVVSFNSGLLSKINPSFCHHLQEHRLKTTVSSVPLGLMGFRDFNPGFLGRGATTNSLVCIFRKKNPFFLGGSLHTSKLLFRPVPGDVSHVFNHSLDDVWGYIKPISNACYANTLQVQGFNSFGINPGFSSFPSIDTALLGSSSRLDAVALKDDEHGSFGESKPGAYFAQGLPIPVSLNNGCNVIFEAYRKINLLSFVSDMNTMRQQHFFDCHGVDRQLSGNAVECLPLGVELDYVIAIERIENFSGHVYNFETEHGMYCADSVITHNCRSTTIPFIDYSALGIPEPETGTRASDKGQVSAELDYEGWLKRQPPEKVQAILGKGKAKLFLDGRVTLAEMVRSDGSEISLAQLQRLN